MIGNLLLAGALSLGQPTLAEAFYAHQHVKQVVCIGSRGTAWRLSRGRFASVDHVTSNAGCTINGKPIKVEHSDPFGDFSIVTVEDDVEGGIPVNCAGFFHGNHYYSVGYARGWPVSVVITIRANNFFHNSFRQWQIFTGIEYVIPGMSGGPILNSAGEAVGEVNAYNKWEGLSWSRPLSETVLCQS